MIVADTSNVKDCLFRIVNDFATGTPLRLLARLVVARAAEIR